MSKTGTESSLIGFEEAAARADAFLEQVVAQAIELPPNLLKAIDYSLLSGGKRLRPGLVLLSSQACGGSIGPALAPAAAIEMIHCFSLIHDDLPAMDDDDLRRGQPSNHKKFGEAMAILAGDALATLPYLIVSRSAVLADAQKSRILDELSDGTIRMIAGQVYDTLGGFDDSLANAERLERTHRNKTGALIRSACRMGAIVANASDDQLEAITSYGEAIGLMFQIVDDVLDVTQTTEHLGKRTNKDEEAGKLTYPAVHGIERSREMIESLRRSALDALHAFERVRVTALIELTGQLASRTK